MRLRVVARVGKESNSSFVNIGFNLLLFRWKCQCDPKDEDVVSCANSGDPPHSQDVNDNSTRFSKQVENKIKCWLLWIKIKLVCQINYLRPNQTSRAFSRRLMRKSTSMAFAMSPKKPSTWRRWCTALVKVSECKRQCESQYSDQIESLIVEKLWNI